MAFSNSTGDRMDELRFRSQQSSRHDSLRLGLTSPPRNGNRLPPPSSSAGDARGGFTLTRRFTTDSGRVPTLSSIASQRGLDGQGQDYSTPPSTSYKVQLLEKKKLEYERLREQKRRFEAEMQILDLQQRQEEQELQRMQEDLSRHGSLNGAGHQSEPTTPPEYRESSSGFPTVFSRPNRYSTSSLTSPIGTLYNRPGRSASTLTTPNLSLLGSRFTMDENTAMRPVFASKQYSDDDDKEQAVRQDPTSHRTGSHVNRYSMPVTKTRSAIQDMLNLDQTNTTRFLFGDEDSNLNGKSYLQLHSTDDNFPILIRGEGPQKTTSSSAALDLAAGQSSNTDSSGWSSFARHRPNQQSLPSNTLSSNGQANGSSTQSTMEDKMNGRSKDRYSQDLGYYKEKQQEQAQASPAGNAVQSPPPKLQASFSANDVPTMKTLGSNTSTPQKPQDSQQQRFHNHNASLGRIPASAVSNRQSRDIQAESTSQAPGTSYPSIQSALQASAPPFGPSATTSMYQQGMPAIAPMGANPYAMPYYNPYNMQMLNMQMQNMQMNPQAYGQNPYASYDPTFTQAPFRDSQAKVIQQRRAHDGDAMNRFANVTLESLGGEIYTLCKDQHGCRYLQKKLEERNPDHIHMIWLETNQHVVELMTDPFGNYLCQKLLEFCNDEERTVLVENAAPSLVDIALNQHGTRALQKMIEFISTTGQVQTIIDALRFEVVKLIQDLNGNHVIQKCLNKLSPHDAQFIFDAVGQHCIDVGTHRHGCCVLQRCIDHASGDQKAWLIRQISNNAIHLVQDPFGNYVVQYILDLNEPVFTEPLVAMFQGQIGALSRQKFSSNVMEKCLRCAQDGSKQWMVEEMLQSPTELERLLRDSFANYVIQTALDYGTPAMKSRLIDAIRPILPQIRTTPYGRRIQQKIQSAESRSGPTSGTGTPAEGGTGQLPLRQQHARSQSNAGAAPYMNPAGIVPYATHNSRAPVTVLPSSAQIAQAGIAAHPQYAQQVAAQFAERGGPPPSGAGPALPTYF